MSETGHKVNNLTFWRQKLEIPGLSGRIQRISRCLRYLNEQFYFLPMSEKKIF